MRIIILFIAVLSQFSTISAEKQFWTNGTSDIIKKGTFEVGVFNSLKYGLTEDTQLETHPIHMIYMPNFTLKQRWIKNSDVSVASKHKVVYPTLLLNLVSREGTGGVLPETTEFPHFILLDNSVSTTSGKELLVTTYVGFVLSIGAIDESITTIDYPLIYPRLNAYYNRYSGYFGTILNFDIAFLQCEFGVKIYALPEEVGVNLSHLEQKSVISYELNSHVLFDLGYNMTTGVFPYGRDFKMFPMVDARFQF